MSQSLPVSHLFPFHFIGLASLYLLSNMSTLKRLLSQCMCCFGAQYPDENPASDLHAFPSAVSVHLSASQVPHAAGPPNSNRTDTDALRELFGASSSSSIRGYRTASIPSGSTLQRGPSFDANFRFGQQDQAITKPPGRLEQLGNHIRQKLSESGLSKSNSKPHMASEEQSHEAAKNSPPLGAANPEVGPSHRSTGLLELLMSRNPSEGGYDSDAKSIQTAMLKSREAIVPLMSPGRHSVPTPETKFQQVGIDGAPPSPPERSRHDADAARAQPEVKADQSHASKRSLTDIFLEIQKNSPKQISNVPSVTVMEKSKWLSVPSNTDDISPFAATGGTEQDPFTTTSSAMDTCQPRQPNTEFVEVLKKLGSTVPLPKRESLISNLTDPRASLMSNLDPTLVEFISRCGERPSVDLVRGRPDDRVVEAAGAPRSGPRARSPAAKPVLLARENTSRKDLASLAESEPSSVHLYNMRISQRLASPSFVASSRPTTSHTTEVVRQNSTEARRSLSQMSRSGNAAGRIATEHLRRPSDPQTRQLFEGDSKPSRPHSPWRRPISPTTLTMNKASKAIPSSDEASSFYWSDGEIENNPVSTCRPPKRNRNSIAIGGRSESISLPVRSSAPLTDTALVAGESAWFGRKSLQVECGIGGHDHSGARNRSVSMPDGNARDIRVCSTLSSRRAHHPTENDEAMSEISLRGLQDARREKMTEISAQDIRDAHNERMSEIVPRDQICGNENPAHLLESWAHAEHSMLPLPITSKRQPGSRREGVSSSTGNERPKLQESATNVWQRTFKRALEEPQSDSLGGFLTSPRFDRDGRRRSTRSSISAVHSLPDQDAQTAPLDSPHRQVSQPKQKRRIEVCIKKPGPLPMVSPRHSIAAVDAKKDTSEGDPKTLRKKSLLDIGGRFSMMAGDIERWPGASTPLKTIWGPWGRFPSHTREERCGPAGAKDGIAVRDFAYEHHDRNVHSAVTQPRSTTALGVYTPGSWKMLSFGKKSCSGKRKTKSAGSLKGVRTTQSMKVSSKYSRKGLAGRWKKLYRSSSTEFRAYTHNYGHRSSISMGARVEYPELEVVPGSPGWISEGDAANEYGQGHHREVAGLSQDQVGQENKLDVAPWTQRYRDCVGSLSALKSEPELGQASLDGSPRPVQQLQRHKELGGMSSGDLRDSTVDFQSQLGKENEAVREGLIRKVESMQMVQG